MRKTVMISLNTRSYWLWFCRSQSASSSLSVTIRLRCSRRLDSKLEADGGKVLRPRIEAAELIVFASHLLRMVDRLGWRSVHSGGEFVKATEPLGPENCTAMRSLSGLWVTTARNNVAGDCVSIYNHPAVISNQGKRGIRSNVEIPLSHCGADT